jgi:hypothetical protein
MRRALYRSLLWLHPPRFRREFGGEMLWIFDQAVASQGAAALLSDAFRSLARQWLLRSGSWKLAAALSLAVLQVTAGGLGMQLFARRRILRLATGPLSSHQQITMSSLIQITFFVVSALSVMVIALSHWVNRLSAKRRVVRHRGRLCSNSAR